VQLTKTPVTEEAVVLELHKDKNWFLVLLPSYDIDELFFIEDLQVRDRHLHQDGCSGCSRL
jgi:hypothetical protein